MTTIDKICEIVNQKHFLLPFKDTYVSDLPVAMLKFHTLTGKKKRAYLGHSSKGIRVHQDGKKWHQVSPTQKGENADPQP